MSAPHNNNSTRSALNTADPNNIHIVHRAQISEKWKTMICWMGFSNPSLCCKKEEVWQSTYLQVHENRIEYNYPGIGCNLLKCCKIQDNVRVHYFDKAIMKNVDKAGPCTPFCTHNTCFPDCCGMCGESVVIHSTGLMCCCKHWEMLTGLESADAVVSAIESAKSHKGGPPPTVTMSHT